MSLSLLFAVILNAMRIFAGYDGVPYDSGFEPAAASGDETVWASDGNGGPPPRK